MSLPAIAPPLSASASKPQSLCLQPATKPPRTHCIDCCVCALLHHVSARPLLLLLLPLPGRRLLLRHLVLLLSAPWSVAIKHPWASSSPYHDPCHRGPCVQGWLIRSFQIFCDHLHLCACCYSLTAPRPCRPLVFLAAIPQSRRLPAPQDPLHHARCSLSPSLARPRPAREEGKVSPAACLCHSPPEWSQGASWRQHGQAHGQNYRPQEFAR